MAIDKSEWESLTGEEFVDNEFNIYAISTLIDRQTIPESGNFDITEEMMFELSNLYRKHKGSNANYTKVARRTSGIMLVKFKLSRNIPISEIKEGIVYAIGNPAWPNWVKVGMTTDISRRLSSYQTSDPFRRYYLLGHEFVLDRRQVERDVLSEFRCDLFNGEWVSPDKIDDVMRRAREEIDFNHQYGSLRDRYNKPIMVGSYIAYKMGRVGYGCSQVKKLSKKAILIDTKIGERYVGANDVVTVPRLNDNKSYLKSVLNRQFSS